MGWSWWALGNRPAVFPALACLLGVVLGPRGELPAGAWSSLLLVSLVVAWARHRRAGGVFGGLGAAFSLGAALAVSAADVDVPPLGVPVRLDGVVTASGARALRVDVSAVGGEPVRFGAGLSAEPLPPLVPGQRVRLEARLRPAQEAANPGEWSRGEWAFRSGQPVTGRFQAARLVTLEAAPGWRRWVEARRASLGVQVRSLGADEATSSFLLTLASGERAALGDELEEIFARSGLAHVLSVSGLHVAVLGFAIFAALRWLLSRRMTLATRRVDPRAFAAPLALPFVWGYVLFTGLQAPAVRSALMVSLLLGATTVRRRSDPLNAIAVAALVMLVLDPAAPFDLSVQLSFTAVVALVLLTPTLRAALPLETPDPRRTGFARWLEQAREAAVQTFVASLAVTLATGPLVMGAFQRVSLAGLVSNVVTLPLSGVLTVLAAAGAGLHLLWAPLATPVLWAGLQLSWLFVAIAERFAAVPLGTAELPAPPVLLALAWWAGLLALVFTRGRWRWLAMAAPAALALHLVGPRDPGALEVTFLAVGHGDAIVVQSRGRTALIDGGGVPGGHDTGKRFVLPFLRQRRVEELELVALSHAHPDHALGLSSTLAELPARRVWLPEGTDEGPLVADLLVAAGDAEVERRAAGSAPLRLGDATLEVLGPPRDADPLLSENDRSLVLVLRHGEVSFLLTGDLEAAGEAALAVGPVTVVKAPHHGSDTSSTPELVAATRPKHVVFCVGRRNRFGFPRPAVVARWREAGAQCHRTDVDGALTFRSDGRDVSVERFGPVGERRARRRLTAE